MHRTSISTIGKCAGYIQEAVDLHKIKEHIQLIISSKPELRRLAQKDHKKAIQFAIEGMHFDWYVNSKLLLNLYGRYFWYMELGNATQIIAAYNDDRLAGVLLCEMKGEPKASHSLWRAAYVGFFNLMQRIFLS